MKLLTNSKEIQKEFKRLMKTYSEYYWAVAWAGYDFEFFELLKNNKNRIKKIVIGTSFDHTHPEFIREFIEHKNVKYVLSGGEVFHPKIYLFKDGENNWEILIGSMNFTAAGFFLNTEDLVLITKGEDNKNTVYDNAMNLISENWNNGEYFTKEKLEEYRVSWQNQERRSGKYGKKKGKPVNQVIVMNHSWHDFISKVRAESQHFEQRVKVLEGVGFFFREKEHFNELDEYKRKAIAGYLRKKDGIDWDLFGSMRGAGVFTHKIKENDIRISKALDKIPLLGEIKYEHYIAFIQKFQQIEFGGRYIFSPATRLLAMKRPDHFVCFDNKNKTKLCKDFGISSSNMTYERYWDEIIQRIRDSDWWDTPQPTDEKELSIWKGRAAFLDALYYED